jgi:hypothetical protein
MAGVKPYIQLGPRTYTVNVAVTGGQLVMPDGTTGKIKPATAGATTVLGQASDDAAPAGSGTSTDYSTLRPEVAVYEAPATVTLTYAADCAFGLKVIAAASGQVTPVGAAAALDGTSVVGICTEPGGVLAGAKGRTKLV